MRRPVTFIFGAGFLIALIAGLYWLKQHHIASQRLARWEAQRQDDAARQALERLITLDGGKTSLKDFAALVSRESGLPVELEASVSGAYEDEPQQPLTVHLPLHLPKGTLTLHSALRLILAPHSLFADVSERKILITWSGMSIDRTRPLTAVYPIPQTVVEGMDEEGWGRIVRGNLPRPPGPLPAVTHVEVVPGALTVVDTVDAHRRVRQLIEAVNRIGKLKESEVPVTLPPAPAGTMEKRILEELDQPTTIEFVETPLRDAVVILAEQHSIPLILMAPEIESAGVPLDTPLTKNLKGISLRSALRLVLRDLELTYVMRDEALVITTPEDAETQLTGIVYPVHELTPEKGDLESLKDVITVAIAPQSWDEVGGPGVIRSIGDDRLLIFHNYVHEQIAELLKRLREMLSGEPGKIVLSATIDDEAEQRIRRALDRMVELDFSHAPLKDVVGYLQETLQIPIVLNAKKLEEASISPDTPVTCHWPKGRAGIYLELLMRELDLTYVIRDEVLQITTPEDAESQLITRIYDARPLLAAGISPDALFAILRNIVSPQSWDMVGGPGSIANFRGIFVVSQTQDVLEKLDRLLVALTTHRAPKTHETEPPLVVRVDSPTSTATVEEALQQTIRVNLEDVALDEAIRQVTKPHHVSFLIDSKSLKEVGVVKMPSVSLPNAEMTLGGALSRLLNPLGLGYRVRDHLLWICTWEESDAHFETRLYRIDDLALSLDGAKSIREKLVAALADEQRVRIDEMSQAIELLGHGWLIVSAERASHQYIEDWLTEQRTGVPAKREVERRNLQDKLRWWGLRQRRPMPAGGMF